MFVDCSRTKIILLSNMINILELSRLCVYLGGLAIFFRILGIEKMAELWFARGISAQADTTS